MSGRSAFSISAAALAFGQHRGGQRRASAILVAAFSFFSLGCGSSLDRAVEEATEQTYPIDPAGTLSIRNPLGSVRISGSDDSEMKLKAIKKAWSAGQLNEIAVKVSAQSRSISVETSFPHQKTWGFSNRSGGVDYAISVPRTIRISRLEVGNGDVLIEGMRGDVRANLVNGALAARSCFGNTELSVANGSLDLFYEKWEQRRFSVEARIISGNARVFLSRKASFHLVAETVNGNVANHLADTGEGHSRRATKLNMSVGAEISFDIIIRATDGNIEIAPAKAE
jgi:DUF4097 and DUF4098 domain-containing protein YvlB